jgi:hypothetical protein
MSAEVKAGPPFCFLCAACSACLCDHSSLACPAAHVQVDPSGTLLEKLINNRSGVEAAYQALPSAAPDLQAAVQQLAKQLPCVQASLHDAHITACHGFPTNPMVLLEDAQSQLRHVARAQLPTSFLLQHLARVLLLMVDSTRTASKEGLVSRQDAQVLTELLQSCRHWQRCVLARA